jgi:hypothetical protein
MTRNHAGRSIAPWIALLALGAAGSAQAQDGCEYVTAIGFLEGVISKGADCRWSDDRGLYECHKGGAPTWDLTVDAPDPGRGRAVAVRDDGFTISYACSCGGSCGFYSPGEGGNASGESSIEPNTTICTGSAERPNEFFEDMWGVTCKSQDGGTYGQVQGYTDYNGLFDDGASTEWMFAFNGKEGDARCQSRVYCSTFFWELGGAPHEYLTYDGEDGKQLDYAVQSIGVTCFCE